MKKLLLIFLIFTMFFSSSVSVFAVNNSQDSEITPNTYGFYFWEPGTTTHNHSFVRGAWLYFSGGQPAVSDGVVVTPSISYTRSTSYSGSLTVTIKKLEAAIGYTISSERTLSYSESITLNKGEYIKAYYRDVTVKDQVIQEEYYSEAGFTVKTGKTATVYGQRPALEIMIELYDQHGELISRTYR